MDWNNVHYIVLMIVLLYNTGRTCAQETTETSCSTGGAIAASVIITFLVTAALIIGTYWWYKRRKQRQGKHLIFETDPEKGNDEYAFDNPGFKDPGLTPMSKSFEKVNKLETPKHKWNQWSPLSALTSKSEKKKIQDDNALDGEIVKVVTLRSRDFTGLGFNINGNMRDGIYIKDVLQKGPASASGKLNSGDRIMAVTISFEHMVYEDALSILSYASPYEIKIEAKSMKNNPQSNGQFAQPGHPLYKSFSTADLLKIEKSSKKCLFHSDDYPESLGSNYSSLQKSRSNLTTLERKEEHHHKNQLPKSQLNTEQLKAQLEQKISEDHDENLRIKNEKAMEVPIKQEAESQKSETKLQKFGVKVFPEQKEQKSPKAAELSQNDNNINLERHTEIVCTADGVDEPDRNKLPPEIKRREKNVKNVSNESLDATTTDNSQTFVRQNSLTGSGIKRDKNGIPQEIPPHMLNAAVAARRNRKTEDRYEREIEVKSPKKLKGKAPAPPPELKNNDVQELITHNVTLDLDQIQSADEIDNKQINTIPDVQPVVNDVTVNEEVIVTNAELNNKNYNSDSDGEVDNNSSVNTIELNASDITIHQTEENEEKQNRKTASTGDLTKIHKGRKTSSGTLERAQSLDITDTGMSPLNKIRTGSNIEFDSKTSSDDSLYGKMLLNKEPRLSLILDGLNTFQRSRLKKSTEWGNLEDAILNLSKDDGSHKSWCESPEKSPEFDALVNKINEIKSETSNEFNFNKDEMEDDGNTKPTDLWHFEKSESVNESPTMDVAEIKGRVKNQIWPTFNNEKLLDETKINGNDNISNMTNDVTEQDEISHEDVLALEEQIRIAEMNLRMSMGHIVEDKAANGNNTQQEHTDVESAKLIAQPPITLEDIKVNNQEEISEGQMQITEINLQENKIDNKDVNQQANTTVTLTNNVEETIQTNLISPANLNTDFILAEKAACNNNVLYNIRSDDTNVSDDMKVSRHSLDKLNQINNASNNVSQVTVNDLNNHDDSSSTTFNIDFNVKKSALPKPAVNVTKIEPIKPKPKNPPPRQDFNNFEYNKLVTTPDLIKNVSLAEAIHNLNNEVTIEGPSSLTLEINDNISPVRSTPISLNSEKLSNGSSNIDDKDDVDLNKNKKQNLSKSVSNLTYITEIQVLTPNKTSKSNPNISEIEIVPSENKAIRNLDTEFEKYVKNFETNIKTFETNIKNFDSTLQEVIKGETLTNNNVKKPEKIMDPEKELHKIQEIAEEQLKKLPEMRFTTSSYESKPQEKRHSHIDQLRSNFERNDKSPSKNLKMDIGATKSRIPVPASTKTPPTSPERRDSRNLDTENQKELLEMMSSATVTSTFKYQPKMNNKNITVTSIRTNSKIPSGLPTYVNRPPVPPRKTETTDNETIIQVSSNGNNDNSFKHWVFNANDSNAVTNITVSDNKDSKS